MIFNLIIWFKINSYFWHLNYTWLRTVLYFPFFSELMGIYIEWHCFIFFIQKYCLWFGFHIVNWINVFDLFFNYHKMRNICSDSICLFIKWIFSISLIPFCNFCDQWIFGWMNWNWSIIDFFYEKFLYL